MPRRLAGLWIMGRRKKNIPILSPDLLDIWAKSLELVPLRATRELLSQKARLLCVFNGVAYIETCGALVSVVERKSEEIRSAINEVLEGSVSVKVFRTPGFAEPKVTLDPRSAACASKSRLPIFNEYLVWRNVVSHVADTALQIHLLDLARFFCPLSLFDGVSATCTFTPEWSRFTSLQQQLSDAFCSFFGEKISVSVLFREPSDAAKEFASFLCDGAADAIATPPIYSANKTADFIEWNGAYLRSEPERVIAEALQRHGLAFHPSHPIRLQINGKWVTREIDFKVILGRNQFAYIEVDGRAYHDSAADDHARDMEFESLTGIRTYRFPAKQCMEDPDGVIEKFLKVTGYAKT